MHKILARYQNLKSNKAILAAIVAVIMKKNIYQMTKNKAKF